MMGDPDFLPRGATNVRLCGFVKESRMEFANAIKFYRKSGEDPTIAFVSSTNRPVLRLSRLRRIRRFRTGIRHIRGNTGRSRSTDHCTPSKKIFLRPRDLVLTLVEILQVSMVESKPRRRDQVEE